MDVDSVAEQDSLLRSLQPLDTAERARRLVEAITVRRNDLSFLLPLMAARTIDEAAFADALRFCIARDANNFVALRALCWHQKRTGDFSGARASLTRLVTLAPRHDALKLELLRAELVAPGEKAQDNIALGLSAITDRLTWVSYHYQLGLVHPAFARPDQRELLLREMSSARGEAIASSFDRIDSRETFDRDAWWEILAMLLKADSIALVGNGPRLEGSGLGASIDAHDAVIRLNFPEMKGHEVDVGRRTHLIAFSEALLDRLPQFLARDPRFVELPRLSLSPIDRKRVFDDPITTRMGFLPNSFRQKLRALSYDMSTTGTFILCLLMLLGKKNIDLFGFDFYADQDRPHYFKGHDIVFSGHDTAYERFFAETFAPTL